MVGENLRYRRNKIKYGKLPPIQINIHVSDFVEVDNMDIDMDKDKDVELLEELLKDLGCVKSKRKLEFFVADNKEYINQLLPSSRAVFLGTMTKIFFN